MIKKEAEKIPKYKDLTIEKKAHVECKNKSDTNDTGNWHHFKTIQKISERTAQYQGTIKNSHIGNCTHFSESTNVKEQNI